MISEVTDRETRSLREGGARASQNGKHDEAAARVADALGIDAALPRDAALQLAAELPEDGLGSGSRDDPNEPSSAALHLSAWCRAHREPRIEPECPITAPQ